MLFRLPLKLLTGTLVPYLAFRSPGFLQSE
jgi:hypothetical protein